MKKLSIIFLIIILISLFFTNTLYATSSQELKKQNTDITNKIEEKHTEISGIETKMTEALNKIVSLNEKISNYEKEIANLNTQISSLNAQISEKETLIQEQEKKYSIQKELLEKRLITIYESGSTNYLDFLLSSSSLTDFISNYYLISTIAETDEELLEKINNTKNKINNEKNSIATLKDEITKNKLNLENESVELVNTKKTKEILISNLSEEELSIHKEIEDLEEDRKIIQEELAKVIKEEKNRSSTLSYNNSNTSHKYIFPVSGLSKSNINNLNYPSYKGHTGIDINLGVKGKNIVAVKAGIVVISKAAKNSDGSYRSYGEYIVINHHDGTMTLYAHMLANSRKVLVNDEVSQGQVIGIVGNTGNSTGTHLHFEVLINGFPVNPLPYLP